MILNSLTLENIRSYAHERIEFPRGITLFEGDVGAGKSTILMAIEFALFGLGTQNATSLLAKSAGEGSVTLNFSVGNNEYEVQRTLTKRNNAVQSAKKPHIKADGKIEPLSVTELKQRILQILKFNEPADPRSTSKIFRYAVFTPQEEMKKVLDDAKVRLETIRKAFGIEDYSIAVSNAKAVSSLIEKKAAKMEGRFADIGRLEGQITASKGMLEGLNAGILQSEKARKTLELEREEIAKRQGQLQDQRVKRARLEGEKSKLEEKIRDGRKSAESVRADKEDVAREMDEFRRTLDDLDRIKEPTPMSAEQIQKEVEKFRLIGGELIKYTTRASELSASVKRLAEKTAGRKKEELQKEVTGKQIELKDAQNSLKECSARMEDLKRQKTERETKAGQLKKNVKKSAELGAVCPVCSQNITEEYLQSLRDKYGEKLGVHEKELHDIEESLSTAAQEHETHSDRIKSLESKISDMGRILPGIEELEEGSRELIDVNAKVAELREQNRIAGEEYGSSQDDPVKHLSALKDARVKYESGLTQMEDVKNNMERAKKRIAAYGIKLESLDNGIEKNTADIQRIVEQLESFSGVDEELESANKKVAKNAEKIIQASRSGEIAKQNLKNENGKIDENCARLEEARKWKNRHDEFLDYKHWLEEFFIPTLNEIEKQVLLSVLQRFNEIYHGWYSILIEDITKESRIDEEFTPVITQDGYEYEVRFLSGGEKTSIALAYRLALNSLMRQETESLESNLLILDEPTDGFSNSQMNKIHDILAELKSKQIILVSHEHTLEAYVENVFHVSKENGVSRITRHQAS